MSNVIGHAFYEVHLGLGHAGLSEILREKVRGGLKQNEFALFLNRSMTACKILSPDSHTMIYYRGSRSMTASLVKSLPTALGGKSFSFGGSLEAKLLKVIGELPQSQQTQVKMLA